MENIILESYYKICRSYIFVYDVAEPDSLKAVSEEINKIKQVVSEDQFFGILIGNSRKGVERKIKEEEIVAVQNKYQLQVSKIVDLAQDDVSEVLELIEFQPARYLY